MQQQSQIFPLYYDLSLGIFFSRTQVKINIGRLSPLIFQLLRNRAVLPPHGYPQMHPNKLITTLPSHPLQPDSLIFPITQGFFQGGALSTQISQKLGHQRTVPLSLSHLCDQLNVPKVSQPRPLCLTAHLAQAPWVPGLRHQLPHLLPSAQGPSRLCSPLEPHDLPCLKNNIIFKFKVMFILEVLDNIGKNK